MIVIRTLQKQARERAFAVFFGSLSNDVGEEKS